MRKQWQNLGLLLAVWIAPLNLEACPANLEMAEFAVRLASIENINLPGAQKALGSMLDIRNKATASDKVLFPPYDFSSIHHSLFTEMNLEEQVAVIQIIATYALESNEPISLIAMAELQDIQESLVTWKQSLTRYGKDTFDAEYLLLILNEALGVTSDRDKPLNSYRGNVSPYRLPSLSSTP